MFKNVIFCTRHTGEQRELKIRPHSSPGNRSPSHRVGLLPLLLQPGTPTAPAAPVGGVAPASPAAPVGGGLLLLPLLLQPGASAAACAQTGSCMGRLPFGDFFFSVHIYLKKK